MTAPAPAQDQAHVNANAAPGLPGYPPLPAYCRAQVDITDADDNHDDQEQCYVACSLAAHPGDWHYDTLDNITWRHGNHVPEQATPAIAIAETGREYGTPPEAEPW